MYIFAKLYTTIDHTWLYFPQPTELSPFFTQGLDKHLFVSPAVIENAKTKDNNNNNESTEIHVSAIPALLPGSQWGTMHLISPTEDAAFIHMTGVNRLHRPWKKINGRMRGEKKKRNLDKWKQIFANRCNAIKKWRAVEYFCWSTPTISDFLMVYNT